MAPECNLKPIINYITVLQLLHICFLLVIEVNRARLVFMAEIRMIHQRNSFYRPNCLKQSRDQETTLSTSAQSMYQLSQGMSLRWWFKSQNRCAISCRVWDAMHGHQNTSPYVAQIQLAAPDCPRSMLSRPRKRLIQLNTTKCLGRHTGGGVYKNGTLANQGFPRSTPGSS